MTVDSRAHVSATSATTLAALSVTLLHPRRQLLCVHAGTFTHATHNRIVVVVVVCLSNKLFNMGIVGTKTQLRLVLAQGQQSLELLVAQDI